MAKTVTATEAQAHILSLLDDVEAGREVEIARHARLVARLVPARGRKAPLGKNRGQVTINVTDGGLLLTANDGSDWTCDEHNVT